MSKFLTELCVKSDGKYWRLVDALVFDSDIVGVIRVPAGFKTDFIQNIIPVFPE